MRSARTLAPTAFAVVLVALLLLPPSATAQSCTVTVRDAGGALFADGFESGDTSAWQEPSASFRVRDVVDLQIDTAFDDALPAEGVLELRLITPRGHHYQTLTLAVSGDPARQGEPIRVEGFPWPLRLNTAASDRGPGEAAVITGSWPVAGTQIVHNALYGRWTVTAILDGAAAACGPAVEVDLRP